ncbi:MAG TPA: hypothetical protein VK983_03850 [Candidatus Limnocylindrales bacterium]|nr:hypothetical protein [Candidatus Limnocylindrales bacterium]
MNKKQLHHVWTRLRGVHPLYIVGVAVIMTLVSVAALRENNLKMIQLRSAVYEADRNNGDVQGALTNLQRYVTTHMNTSTYNKQDNIYPPIQLQYTYERIKAAGGGQISNDQLYIEAQAHCERTNPEGFGGRFRVPCIQEYIKTNGARAATVPDALYKYDFIAPKWSPDFAGWSVAATVLCYAAALGLWLVRRWFQSNVR